MKISVGACHYIYQTVCIHCFTMHLCIYLGVHVQGIIRGSTIIQFHALYFEHVCKLSYLYYSCLCQQYSGLYFEYLYKLSYIFLVCMFNSCNHAALYIRSTVTCNLSKTCYWYACVYFACQQKDENKLFNKVLCLLCPSYL